MTRRRDDLIEWFEQTSNLRSATDQRLRFFIIAATHQYRRHVASCGGEMLPQINAPMPGM
jgi:hypothetical protein